VSFDQATGEYLQPRFGDVENDISGNVTKFNTVSGWGRFYDRSAQRTIPFLLAPNLTDIERALITWSLHQTNIRAVGTIYLRAQKRAISNSVFVVHGRDSGARSAMFEFLRAIGVKPIEWTSAIAMSKKAAPFISEILDAAFARARAVVVLMTPDDLAQLRPDLLSNTDKPYERTPTGQARPNVLFEAGMAFATHADRTVLVQLGNLREFSDVGGRHVMHMSNEFTKRQELATKLTNAGCDVDVSGTDSVDAGDFSDPLTRVPKKSQAKGRARGKAKR